MRIVMEEAGVEYRIASQRPIRTPFDAAAACKQMAANETEAFCVVLLNAKSGMIASEVVTTGILDASLVHPREVFRRAIAANASAIVLAHNHPSGDITPSAEDLRITRQLIEAGRIIDIKVVDHVIIGIGPSGGLVFASLREQGLCQF